MTNKTSENPKTKTVSKDNALEEKNRRKRRDDSSDTPGSPPGVFKVTHHKL